MKQSIKNAKKTYKISKIYQKIEKNKGDYGNKTDYKR